MALGDKISALMSSMRGNANGVASLDDNAKIPIEQMPNAFGELGGRVDVLEDYHTEGYQADENDPGGYIGMKIEGGGTIFFDYKIGYGYGSLTVPPITANLHTYHVDPTRNIVVCDDPNDTSKVNRFYVVSDYDIGDYVHGECLSWASTDLTTMYNVSLGTSTAFGQGYSNTEKCITAATNGGAVEWNALAYKNIWHYLWKGDWQSRNPKWFLPSKDEINVLLNMQWQDSARRKSYDGNTTLKQLPINFYAYYWSSSESSATVAHVAHFYLGTINTYNKNYTRNYHARLVKTF